MDDKFKLCAINEYCDDVGSCRPVKEHFLFKKPCNVDIGLKETKFGICGPLRCYSRECVPCYDGMTDYADSKVCILQEWTYEPSWIFLLFERIYLLIFFLVFMFYLILDFLKFIIFGQ
jgi:hypothetical protein